MNFLRDKNQYTIASKMQIDISSNRLQWRHKRPLFSNYDVIGLPLI